MPKIRGVKPDFWTDDDICELSAYARLLFIGLWNYACDNGHLQDKPKQIKRRILPGDDVNCADLLREIEAAGLIERDAGWITVRNLRHHQKVDLRYFTTCDREDCQPPEKTVSQRAARRAHTVGTTSARSVPDVGTPCALGDGDGDGEVMVKGSEELPRATVVAPVARFDEFWNIYDKKRDRKKCEQKYRLALRKKGVTADLLISSARSYIEHQRRTGKHPEYTKDPATWLNNESWTNEPGTPTEPTDPLYDAFDKYDQLARSHQ